MCGIIWMRQRNQKPAVKKLRKAYRAQSSRGTQGFGFVDISNGIVGELVRRREEEEIFKALSPNRSPEILFHHRFPTSTPNTEETAHPIPVSHETLLKYDYVVVHNGVISNDDMLKEKHEELGFNYTTELRASLYSPITHMVYYTGKGKEDKFNDSEALAIDLALAIEGNKGKTEAFGSIAFIVLQIEKETRRALKLYFGHNDRSPLKIDMTDTFIKLSSEGFGYDVEEHKLHYFDYNTGEIITEKDFEIGFKYTKPTHHVREGSPWNEGKVWDYELREWVEKPEAGFKIQKPLALAERTVHFNHGDEAYDMEIESDFTPIPGYDGSSLKVKLTTGEKEFFFAEELVEEYCNVIEEVELWRDSYEAAKRDRDTDLMSSYGEQLALSTADELALRKEVDKIYPNGIPRKETEDLPVV